MFRPSDERIRSELAQCARYARDSADRSTQNGAILLGPLGQFYGSACNRHVGGDWSDKGSAIHEDPSLKAMLVGHAEERVLARCSRSGRPLAGTTLVTLWGVFPVVARLMVESGVARLVVCESGMRKAESLWPDQIGLGLEILRRNKVEVTRHRHDVRSGYSLLFDGEAWEP